MRVSNTSAKGHLIVVMFGDDSLNSDGAGHGSFLAADESTSGSDGKSGDVPDGQQGRRPNAVAGHHVLKGSQVILLLKSFQFYINSIGIFGKFNVAISLYTTSKQRIVTEPT